MPLDLYFTYYLQHESVGHAVSILFQLIFRCINKQDISNNRAKNINKCIETQTSFPSECAVFSMSPFFLSLGIYLSMEKR